MRKKILIVDDEPDILEFLKYNLEKHQYVVQTALNGKDALKIVVEFEPQVVVMDIMMPKMNGVEACEKIKSNPKFKDLVVLFLSARNEEFTQIACYDAGAEDFISKPIQPKIFLKKIEVFFKRFSQSTSMVNGVEIDKEKYKVMCNSQEVKLTKKQFDLLTLLFEKPDKVFSRESIINEVWGSAYYVSSRNIDVQIRKIREKIGDDKIVTVKGVGYKFVASSNF